MSAQCSSNGLGSLHRKSEPHRLGWDTEVEGKVRLPSQERLEQLPRPARYFPRFFPEFFPESCSAQSRLGTGLVAVILELVAHGQDRHCRRSSTVVT
jgi:hypothetical protein